MLRRITKTFLIILTLIFSLGFVMTRQPVVDSMTHRFETNRATIIDHLHLRILYGTMLAYGYFIYPEASEALFKVLFMPKNNLRLSSDYFYNHKDIKAALAQGKTKIMYGATAAWKKSHPEYYYPEKIEYRLFYAFNPLYLEPETNTAWFGPYRYTRDWSIYTPFKVGWLIDFRLKDALMHKVSSVQAGRVSFKYNPEFSQ